MVFEPVPWAPVAPAVTASISGSLGDPRSYALASSRFASACLRLERNSVLSIRPWKIGTPISIHREMTSLRCMPASRPSSVGVRWIAMYLSPPRGLHSVYLRLTIVPVGATKSPQTADLDRVRSLDEAVLHAEALREELAEPAHPERLRGVVARRDEVRAALSGVGHRVLRGLAREERVEPERDRLPEARRRGSRDDPDAADELGPGIPRERLLAEGGGAARAELVERDSVRRAAHEPDAPPAALAESLSALEPERRADQSVVAHLGVGVERQVVGRERDVVVEQDAQALPHRERQLARVEVPEEPVVGDHELRPERGRALEQLPVRRHARDDAANLVRSRDL